AWTRAMRCSGTGSTFQGMTDPPSGGDQAPPGVSTMSLRHLSRMSLHCTACEPQPPDRGVGPRDRPAPRALPAAAGAGAGLGLLALAGFSVAVGTAGLVVVLVALLGQLAVGGVLLGLLHDLLPELGEPAGGPGGRV